MRTAPLALLLTLALSACGRSREVPAARAARVEIGPERTTIEIEGVTIEVAPDVRCRLDQVISAGPGGGIDLRAMTLDGHPFELRAGQLFIGEADLGTVAAGARVSISREDGVVVDGEPRGAVPAPLETPP